MEPPLPRFRMIAVCLALLEEEPVMAVFCHQCGTGLPPSARFCSNCGTVIPVTQPMPGRPLVRPRAGRQIAGVCLALAQANGWDVAIVRIFTVLGFCFSGGICRHRLSGRLDRHSR